MCVSVCLVVGRCRPSPPLIMLIIQTCWAVFCSGNRLLLFFTCSLQPSPLSSLYPTDTSLSFSLINPPPPLYPNSLPVRFTRPLRGLERERVRQRETGQACTVENIVYARHKAACNFCSRGDTRAGKEGREAVGREGTDGDRQEVKQN